MRTYPRLSVLFPLRRSGLRLRCLTASFAMLLAPMLARTSDAAWQPDGVPLSPLPTAFQSHNLRGLAADGSGGAYVIWEFRERRFTGDQVALIAQRVNASGNRPAPWAAEGSTIRSWDMSSPTGTHGMDPIGLFEDGIGGTVLATLDYTVSVESMNLFRLYHIAPGAVVGPIDIVNTSLGGYPVLMADADGDGAGGVVMIGLQQTFAPPPDPRPPSPLYAQRIDAAGMPLWPASGSPGTPGVELNTAGETAPTAYYGFSQTEALSDGAGGGFFAWIDARDPGDPDVYVQHVDAAGVPLWGAGGVLVCGAAGNQFGLHLARDGAGGVIVVWMDERSGVGRIYAHHLLVDGALDPNLPVDGRPLPSSDLQDVAGTPRMVPRSPPRSSATPAERAGRSSPGSSPTAKATSNTRTGR